MYYLHLINKWVFKDLILCYHFFFDFIISLKRTKFVTQDTRVTPNKGLEPLSPRLRDSCLVCFTGTGVDGTFLSWVGHIFPVVYNQPAISQIQTPSSYIDLQLYSVMQTVYLSEILLVVSKDSMPHKDKKTNKHTGLVLYLAVNCISTKIFK